MKININLESVINIIKKYKVLVFLILVIFFIAAMSVGSYLAVNPSEDEEAARIGQEELDKMNTSFDKKIIDGLEKKKVPAVIDGSAGRNPFMPY